MVHPGSAPEWVVRKWILELTCSDQAATEREKKAELPPMAKLIERDLNRIERASEKPDDIVLELLDVESQDIDVADEDLYWA